jgi:hypothetical protein
LETIGYAAGVQADSEPEPKNTSLVIKDIGAMALRCNNRLVGIAYFLMHHVMDA